MSVSIKKPRAMFKREIRYMIVALLTAAAVALSADSFAQYYHAGEHLEYRVSYRAKLFPHTDVATATVDTSLDTLDGRTVYKVFGHGRVMPAFRWFYDLDDRYTIWVDTATLRTQQFLSEIHEGSSYEKTSRFRYDWERMQSDNSWFRRNKVVHTRTLDLTPQSMDAISLFFNMRGVDDAQLFDDQSANEGRLEMMLEDTIRVLKFRFMGRETKRIGRLGKFRTLKFSCQIGTEDAFSFTDGSEFFIWISDDRNKVPLWLESPIRIGSICARLMSYDNLKYPVESKVK